MKDDTTRDGGAELADVPSHQVPEAPEADQEDLADVPYSEIATAPEDDSLQSNAGEFAPDENEQAAPEPADPTPGDADPTTAAPGSQPPADGE